MLHARTLLIIFSAMLALLGVPGRADSQVIDVVTEELPPLQVVQNGKVSGFATEIVDAALTRAGIDHTITVYPWARAYNLALSRGNTCIYSIARTPEREDKFKWASPLAMMRTSLYSFQKAPPCSPASIEEAKTCIVVVTRNDVVHQYLLSKGFAEGKNLFVVSNSREAFRALSTFSDVSLVIMDNLTLNARAQEANIPADKLKPLFALPEFDLEQWVAFSKATPDDVVARFTRAFESLRKDATISRTKAAWGLPE